jgi:hypothetical protein
MRFPKHSSHWFLAAVLCGCLAEDGGQAGGSMVENEILAGILYLADGTPAARANVRIYTVDHVPGQPEGLPKSGKEQTLVYSTRTDAKGRYEVDSLPRGEYNILGQKDEQVSYQDSVYLSSSLKSIDSDTLRESGSVTGWVRLQPNHSLETVTIQALGTNSFANADAEGKFTLGGLGEGRYSIRVLTTEAQYTPLYTSITARSGKEDTLADTLRLTYTGIPVVMGLQVKYDTLRGVATLSWNKVRYAHFQSYQIFRNLSSDLVPSSVPLSSSQDTVIEDTLYQSDNLADSLVQRFQYRVRVVNKSDQTGLSYGFVSLIAPSPYFVLSSLDFDAFNYSAGRPVTEMEASPQDSLRVNLWFRNPTRKLKRVEWYVGGFEGRLAKTLELDPPVKSGVGSVAYVTSGEIGTDTLSVKVWDETGKAWNAQLGIKVSYDPPKAQAGADMPVSRGSIAHLHGSASDRLGRIAMWEWDIGSKGTFVKTSGGDTSFTVPDSFAIIPCVLRVTDDDGLKAVDTVNVFTSLIWDRIPYSEEGHFQGLFQGHQSVVFDGKLWVLGGATHTPPQSADSRYLPLNYFSSDGVKWQPTDSAQVFTNRAGHAAVVHMGRIWVMGGNVMKLRDPSGPWRIDNLTRGNGTDVWSSMDGRIWDKVTETGFPPLDGFTVVSFHGKMWAIGSIWRQDNSAGVWYSEDGVAWTQTNSASSLPPTIGHATAVFKDRIWVTGGTDINKNITRSDVWSSGNGIDWEQATPDGRFPPRSGHNTLVFGNKLWLFGGGGSAFVPILSDGWYYDRSRYGDIWYSEDGIKWNQPTTELPLFHFGYSTAVFNGRMWMLFGYRYGPGYFEGIWNAH